MTALEKRLEEKSVIKYIDCFGPSHSASLLISHCGDLPGVALQHHHQLSTTSTLRIESNEVSQYA